MKSLFLTAVVVFGITITTLSQSLFCSSSLVVDISKDTVLDGYLIWIHFDAPSEYTVTFPYIETVLNCEGDTIGTGENFWAVQMGQTTQYYPVIIITDTICYPATFVFLYETGIGVDTCLFTYSEPMSTEEINTTDITVYPNPAQDEIRIKSNGNIVGEDYVLYNNIGMLVITGKIKSENTSIDIMELPKGMYYLGLQGKTIKVIKN
jgi:hypothetical protein